jgi:putative ABC transport system permease protein
MLTLHIKLRRELIRNRWQNLAIALVLAAGVAIVLMSISTLQSLESTRQKFYEQTRFAHLFFHLKRAPRSLLERVRRLADVQAVEARIVLPVTLDVPGLAEPATGRLISVPDHDESQVNRLDLRLGRWLDPLSDQEALVSEAFAAAHHLRPGSRLRAVIHGKQQTLHVVGIVLSPEFVYSVRPGELLPDDKRFGVLWMNYEGLSSASDLHDAFNDLALTLTNPAAATRILAELDNLLAPYGGTNGYGRDLQPSHRFLENELIQLRTMALVPPAIFLFVTAFLLQVVMSRLVAMEREQIATLRAFGYSRSKIAQHFFLYAFLVALAGILIGTILGAKMGFDLTRLYSDFFRFPATRYQLDWRLVVATSAVALIAVLSGVWHAVWQAASQPPAQSMQPLAPTRGRQSVFEHLGFQRFLSPTQRLILRHLERRPLRSSLSMLGIALSIGLLIMGNFLEDTVEHVMSFQFFEQQRHDMMVSFSEPTSGAALAQLRHYPGVLYLEPFRAVPVRLVHEQHQRRLELLGLQSGARLFRVIDPQRGLIELPLEGLAISRRLAQLLNCRPGDRIRVEVLEGKRMTRELLVTRIIDDYLDLNAYVDLGTLRRLLQEQDTVSGAFLTADSHELQPLYHELKQTPVVAGVSIKAADIQSYRETMAKNLLRMKMINVVFASIVAVGVVYNHVRISLAERSRELATLRVLGFTRGETARILFGELAILVTAAIPCGLLVGYGLAWLLTSALQTEVHRFPLIIGGRTYAFAVLVIVLAAMVSSMIVRRRLDGFNLVEVLKARD